MDNLLKQMYAEMDIKQMYQDTLYMEMHDITWQEYFACFGLPF